MPLFIDKLPVRFYILHVVLILGLISEVVLTVLSIFAYFTINTSGNLFIRFAFVLHATHVMTIFGLVFGILNKHSNQYTLMLMYILSLGLLGDIAALGIIIYFFITTASSYITLTFILNIIFIVLDIVLLLILGVKLSLFSTYFKNFSTFVESYLGSKTEAEKVYKVSKSIYLSRLLINLLFRVQYIIGLIPFLLWFTGFDPTPWYWQIVCFAPFVTWMVLWNVSGTLFAFPSDASTSGGMIIVATILFALLTVWSLISLVFRLYFIATTIMTTFTYVVVGVAFALHFILITTNIVIIVAMIVIASNLISEFDRIKPVLTNFITWWNTPSTTKTKKNKNKKD